MTAVRLAELHKVVMILTKATFCIFTKSRTYRGFVRLTVNSKIHEMMLVGYLF